MKTGFGWWETWKMVKNRLQSSKTTIRLSAAAFFVLVAVFLLIFWNGIGLYRAVNRRTQNYLRDVSLQTTKMIESRMQGLVDSLRLMSDSLLYLDPEEWAGFLERKGSIVSFDEVVVVGLDGMAEFAEGGLEDISGLDAFQSAAEGNAAVSKFHNDYLVYLTPLVNEGAVTGVLAGVKSQDRMQELISNDSFGGQGSTCILDRDGTVVVAPIQQQFSKDIAETEYDGNEAWALEMLEDLRDNRSGTVTLETVFGEKILVHYQPLGTYGWFVTTIIPENILSSEVDTFISRTYYIILLLVGGALVLSIVAISMQNRYRMKLEQAAFTDDLTGGISMIRFRILAEGLLRKHPPGTYALVAVDLKKFKLINDMEGPEQGDRVLRRVYQILLEALEGPEELAAHSDADSFYLLLKGTEESGLRKRLREIADKIAPLSGAVGTLFVSQGVYIIDSDQGDLITYQDRANLARNSAVDGYGSTCVFYSAETIERDKDEAMMTQMLEKAFANREFEVYLQPKIGLKAQSLAGAEALVRWNHPEKGLISPGLFIPICEKNGLICDLDRYVFEAVCNVLRTWSRDGRKPIRISVNLSRQNLKNQDFLQDYVSIRECYGVNPAWIELELTESIMFSNAEILHARRLIEEIHRCGFRCSLDDFGSGYSALGLLKDLPIDCLKLDRQFFMNSTANDRAQAVIASIVELSRRLGIETVAEGVEEEAQVAFCGK